MNERTVMRKNNNPITKILIPYDLNDCTGCPMVRVSRTMGAGYAHDYKCSAMDNRDSLLRHESRVHCS